MRGLLLIFFLCCHIINLKAQDIPSDSVRVLEEVAVNAYAYDRKPSDVPATVAVLHDDQLIRFSNTSLLPAVNMIPAVRMEERSPGSYRFSIRGSSLRSPFGVRNVKFYWNALPLTDGGGNTYLNLIDLNAVGSMEVIKGPGSSLYGAGTGGVVLLRSPDKRADTRFTIIGGSYGLLRTNLGGSLFRSDKLELDYSLSYQKADGYRTQTNMTRATANFDLRYRPSSQSMLYATVLLSDLYYQTPGGLTRTQYLQDPSQARPASAAGPGAVEQQASVTNKTGYSGIYYEHDWNAKWSSRIGIYGSLTDFVNPTLRNYELRTEQNWGGRTDTQYHFELGNTTGKFIAGAEYQHFYSPFTDYDNNAGVKGSLQTSDLLRSSLLIGFTQIDLDLPHKVFISAGVSVNSVQYGFARTSSTPQVDQNRIFSPVLSPRIAVLKKVNTNISFFASISNGFSPPSLAEVRPSTATFNNSLNAERGNSYELGLKGGLLKRLEIQLTGYDFRLNDAIVIQRDPSGADFFVNAGSTRQLGMEAIAAWTHDNGSRQYYWKGWISYTFNDYHFDHYVTSGNDYSGNALTGVAPTVLAAGYDVKAPAGWYVNLTMQYSDRLPLNDGNTEYADSYFLIGFRSGYYLKGKLPLEFFAGTDNLLDQRYTLGADINAAGGRYYNAAALRNFYLGLGVRIPERKP